MQLYLQLLTGGRVLRASESVSWIIILSWLEWNSPFVFFTSLLIEILLTKMKTPFNCFLVITIEWHVCIMESVFFSFVHNKFFYTLELWGFVFCLVVCDSKTLQEFMYKWLFFCSSQLFVKYPSFWFLPLIFSSWETF